jgi:FAD:protein FMN transferase
MQRRDFLNPRRLASAAGLVLGAVDELATLPDEVVTSTEPPEEDIALLRIGYRAMATGFEFVVPFATDGAMDAARASFELLEVLEEQLTVYRDTSEVSRLNRLASRRPVVVESRLFALLQLAGHISTETDGAFDITAGTLIKAWGFFRGPRRVPSEVERQGALARVGMTKVVLDAKTRSVRYSLPGLEINLGSIGKGYALDRLIESLDQKWNLPAVLLHGGSSSVYAKGDPREGARGRGWPVRIRHPWDEERSLATVWLKNRGLGTSAATFQYLEHEGRKLGHVLDPRIGWPASGLASVSVVARTSTEADALSTAFYVGGLEFARHYCESHPGVGALVLPEDSDEVVILGLTADEYTLPPVSLR